MENKSIGSDFPMLTAIGVVASGLHRFKAFVFFFFFLRVWGFQVDDGLEQT